MSDAGRTLEISGVSPFRLSSGVFEVQIAICASPPPTDEIARKSFSISMEILSHLENPNGMTEQPKPRRKRSTKTKAQDEKPQLDLL